MVFCQVEFGWHDLLTIADLQTHLRYRISLTSMELFIRCSAQTIIRTPADISVSFLAGPYLQSSHRKRLSAITASNNRQDKFSLGDQLLDYIEGGPKLRKWYGAPEQVLRDGGDSDSVGSTSEESQFLDEVRDAVLVTDADSMTGQLVLLSLILRRVRVRALVKDAKEMIQAFGSYVEPVVGDVADPKSLKKALRGVRAVLCSTKVGALADKEITEGIEHIVFLSQFAAYSNAGGLAGLLNMKARRQAEEEEAAIRNLGIPCTIVRSATLRDEPGGLKGFNFKEGCTQGGSISREDAALICVKALDFPPKEAIVFEVASGDDLVDDWGALFNSLNGSSLG
ncbi:hypothetical protein GOP47_0027392 [Adiantum capillus-veneris]|nr:hypothetical protein GOP47_0027392 [Adiantum capillus-veneris]